jgi:WS/DGAT/MGAT family acyltransferase
MDNDVNLMMIVGVWLLTPAVSLDAVRRRVADKLLKYPRFRQRVHHDAVGASWVEDEHFDLNHHVAPVLLRREAGQTERQALQALCATLATEPLDARHPLWQFLLVEDYEGGCALVARIHHCIADGIALISVMQSITDGGIDPPRRRRRHPAPDADTDWLADGVARSLDVLSNPQQLMASVDMVRTGYKVLHDVAAMALLPDDSPTLLKGKPMGRKAVAWSEPLPLDAVKAVGKALNCSVNDVLLSCAAGAIGQYLHALGDNPAGKEIRAMVPVNLRPLDKAWQLGNRFGLAPLTLPVGIANPVERVYDVHRRMAELKGSYQPLLAFAVLSLTGLLIKPAQDAVLGMFAKKTTAVMTNVPGPTEPLRFCGSTLRQSLFWVPASGDVGVGVSILSYAGGVQFGLITDQALCPDPQRVIDGFAVQFDQLLWLTLMLPWGADDADPQHPASSGPADTAAAPPPARPRRRARR